VRPREGERKPVDQSALPKLAEKAGEVFVARNKSPDLGCWSETETKNHLCNIQVEIGDRSDGRLFRSNEF
jgi:hypothetical protein